MNEIAINTFKTPLAKWLFEHDVTLREGALLFRTNRTSLGEFARGIAAPTGETRELIAAVLLGERSLKDIREALANG